MANPLKALLGQYGSDSEDEAEPSPEKKRKIESGPGLVEAFLKVHVANSKFHYSTWL